MQCFHDNVPSLRLSPCGVGLIVTLLRPPSKQSLFPVQRMAKIVASRAAAKSFSPPFLFVGVRNSNIFLKKRKKYF